MYYLKGTVSIFIINNYKYIFTYLFIMLFQITEPTVDVMQYETWKIRIVILLHEDFVFIYDVI